MKRKLDKQPMTSFNYEDHVVKETYGKIISMFNTGDLLELKCTIVYTVNTDKLADEAAEAKRANTGNGLAPLVKRLTAKYNDDDSAAGGSDDGEEEEDEEAADDDDDDNDSMVDDREKDDGKRIKLRKERVSFKILMLCRNLPVVHPDAKYLFDLAEGVAVFPPLADHLFLINVVLPKENKLTTIAKVIGKVAPMCKYFLGDTAAVAEIKRLKGKVGVGMAGNVPLRRMEDFMAIRCQPLRNKAISLCKDTLLDASFYALVGIYSDGTLRGMTREERESIVADMRRCDIVKHLFTVKTEPLCLRVLKRYTRWRFAMLHMWLSGTMPTDAGAPAAPESMQTLQLANELWMMWYDIMVATGRCDWDMEYVTQEVEVAAVKCLDRKHTPEDISQAWEYMHGIGVIQRISDSRAAPTAVLKSLSVLRHSMSHKKHVKIALFEGSARASVPTITAALSDNKVELPANKLVVCATAAAVRHVNTTMAWTCVNISDAGAGLLIGNARLIIVDGIHMFSLAQAIDFFKTVFAGPVAKDDRQPVFIFFTGQRLASVIPATLHAPRAPICWSHFLSSAAMPTSVITATNIPLPEQIQAAFDEPISFETNSGKKLQLFAGRLYRPHDPEAPSSVRPTRRYGMGPRLNNPEIEMIRVTLDETHRQWKAEDGDNAPLVLFESQRVLHTIFGPTSLKAQILVVGESVMQADGGQAKIAMLGKIGERGVLIPTMKVDLTESHALAYRYRLHGDDVIRSLQDEPLYILLPMAACAHRFTPAPTVMLVIASPTAIMASALVSAIEVCTSKLLLLLPATMGESPPMIVNDRTLPNMVDECYVVMRELLAASKNKK